MASSAIPAVFPPVLFNVSIDGMPHQALHVDGGASNQTFLYPASLRPPPNTRARRRTIYVVRNGRLSADWEQTEASTTAIAKRTVSTLITNSGVGDMYRIYGLAKRDGLAFRLAYIENDFRALHPAEFDPEYMTKLFDYARAKARSGYHWHEAQPGL